MALHLRAAGWKTFHPARPFRRRSWAGILLATGVTALLGGAGVLTASLAPMWGIGAETATMTAIQPLEVPSVAGSAGGPSISASIQKSVNDVITAPPVLDRPVDGIAFQMRIPAIGYSSAVVEGVDTAHLEKGPGHYPTTAWPGRPGNVGIAAHNVYWLSFSRLKAGDQVEIQTLHGLYLYKITGSKVVEPDDPTVLQSTAERQLTLTTCYPLWAGVYATQRLVFSAQEIGGVG